MSKEYQGTFRRLIAWQKAKELTKNIYKIVNRFPKEETYGLVSQMKRCAVSVMSNIAEGNQRAGRKDKLNFFNIAFSSLTELDNQTELAFELEYISQSNYDKLIELINKTSYLLFRLIESKKNPKNPKNLNNPNSPNKKGFSLVELLVVVGIVAVLSVSSVVGFSYLGDILKVREVTGLIADTVKHEELKILRGDFEKAIIHLKRDYLVIEESPEDVSLDLSISDVSEGECSACSNCTHKLNYGHQGTLTQRDEDGAITYIKNVGSSQSDCIAFKDSEEIEWSYQITDGDQFSSFVRFVHFNVQRENRGNNPIHISQEANAKVEIRAPYGKKIIYNSGGSSVGWIDLEVKDEAESTTDTLTIR